MQLYGFGKTKEKEKKQEKTPSADNMDKAIKVINRFEASLLELDELIKQKRKENESVSTDK